MDSDTSMASITVARSSGCSRSTDGRAIAVPSVARLSSSAPAAACRRQPSPLGARVRSRSTLVNFIAYERRRNWRHT
jgi:hypothetical protein